VESSFQKEYFMTVKEVKAIAKEWVEKRAAELPDFFGAYSVGSINHMNEDDLFPSSSDIDLRIIVGRELPSGLERITGEFRQQLIPYEGVLLEPIYIGGGKTPIPEKLLRNTNAYHWSVPNVVLDPSGQITRVQDEATRCFSEKRWVLERCNWAKQFAVGAIKEARSDSLNLSGYNDINLLRLGWFWVFGLCFFVQIPCIADLKGITNRRAFMLSRQTLEKYGESRLFQEMLAILGSFELTESAVREKYRENIEAYEYAMKVIRTPSRGDFDICETARPMITGGSSELIDSGYYKEAMYRIVMERCWFQNAIDNDAPQNEKAMYRERWEALRASLGYAAETDLERKMATTEALIPEVMKVAERIAEKTGR
jgi:hypothetical protein